MFHCRWHSPACVRWPAYIALSCVTFTLCRCEPGQEENNIPFDMGFLKTLWPILLAVSIALCVLSFCTKCLYRYCSCRGVGRSAGGTRSPASRLLHRNDDSIPVWRLPNLSGLPSIFPVGRMRSGAASSQTGTTTNPAALTNGRGAGNDAVAGSAGTVANVTPPSIPSGSYYPWSAPAGTNNSGGTNGFGAQVPPSVPQASAPPRQLFYGTYNDAMEPPPYQLPPTDAPPPYCTASDGKKKERVP